MASVLIIEDDGGLRSAFSAVLTDAGYTALGAQSAEDAILMLETAKSTPSVIVLDLGLPGLGGGHFLNWARHQKTLRHVPVIVVTGADDVHKKLDSRPDRILSKPVTPDELSEAVKTALSGVDLR